MGAQEKPFSMEIEHLEPEGLHHNPAFSQVVRVQGPATLLFVGGQNAVDASGALVGEDLGVQTEQALRNVLTALAAAGAAQANVVKLNVHVVQGTAIAEAFAAAQRVWGRHATAITVLVVAGLANPRFLVEVDAIAAV
jgi:2-iminobutanoate/2-iminopropanoate deaminase